MSKIKPQPNVLYWYKFQAKYADGIFQATPEQIEAALSAKAFEYDPGNGGCDDISAKDFSIICRADLVPHDFKVGVNPIEQYEEQRDNPELYPEFEA